MSGVYVMILTSDTALWDTQSTTLLFYPGFVETKYFLKFIVINVDLYEVYIFLKFHNKIN